MSDRNDLENDDLENEPGLLDDEDLGDEFGLGDPESMDLGDEDLTDEGSRAAQLEEELAATKDRMLRLAADLENTRRRAQKEKTEAAQYGISGFARDLLSVADNFQRALQSAPEEGAEVTAETMAGLINGIRMTEKELLSVFERNGVKRVFPEGEKFDPHLHQAIAHVPGNGKPAGHVVDVAQPGFVLGERVLRAAMVTVSSGE
ncbi:nucleotide exchange factor GrpE [Parvularcula flava]|uniref:Protein GrpE n=1 Tax=Aquisalinus luteolus TaxID=1566827 RepID=A0A8J3ER38_9PROT|nr:nucleotide exchange factor GrpE [Aquisalinus luteolus]NHK28020.1 nucleotide exchange factor GrpE [Aquisalinus luteolus]GGH97224.1 hypothetical protein GCM10011355_17920 [Aquisalinus luteolus]